MIPGFDASPLRREFKRLMLRSLSAFTSTDKASARSTLSVPSKGEIQSQSGKSLTTGGTSTAFTITTDGSLAALTDGEEYDIKFHTAAGTTPTLNRDGQGAKNLKYRDSTGAKQPVTSVQAPSGWRSPVFYDGTDYVMREIPSSIGPAFSGYCFATQSLTSGAFTLIQITNAEFDTHSAFDLTTNYRFQPTVPGYYQVSAAFTVGTSASQTIAAIFKNGSNFKRGDNNTAGYGGNVSALVYLNGSTDYIDFRALVGTTQNVSTGADSTYFSAIFIRS